VDYDGLGDVGVEEVSAFVAGEGDEEGVILLGWFFCFIFLFWFVLGGCDWFW
jgi:hypothetical protein